MLVAIGATDLLAAAFLECGYRVVTGDSPWVLDPGDAALIAGKTRPAVVGVDWFEIWTREYWIEYLGPIGGRIGHPTMIKVEQGNVIRGQYAGYREAPGVDPDSQTETFAALKLAIDSWRWADVPFFIRTGKRMPVTATEVMATFRRPPQRLFDETVPPRANPTPRNPRRS